MEVEAFEVIANVGRLSKASVDPTDCDELCVIFSLAISNRNRLETGTTRFLHVNVPMAYLWSFIDNLIASRLLNAFAEEQATEDAIYYMGDALRKGVIELDVFLKVCARNFL